MTIDEVLKKHEQIRNESSLADATLISAKSEIAKLTATISETKKELDIAEKSMALLLNIVEDTRGKALRFMESIVNEALKEIFVDKKVEIKLEYDASGARKRINISVIENGEEFKLKRRGGGLRQVVSFGLLVVVRYLAGIKTPICLDESLNAINSFDSENDSNQYTVNTYSFVKTICQRLGMQVILVTGKSVPEAITVADNCVNIINDHKSSVVSPKKVTKRKKKNGEKD